jgi:hypothetical protein
MRRLLFVVLLLSGCGQTTNTIRMVPNVVAGTQTGANAHGVGVAESALRIGSPSGTDLKSLKYFITGIQLCQDVNLSGSGFSGTNGCIALYQSSGSSPDYNTYTVAEAMADNAPGHYVDLMTAEGQAALRQPVTLEVPVAKNDQADAGASEAGAYHFGLINFYRPIKVTAEFPIIGQPGEYFRTRADTHVTAGMTADGRFNTNKVQIGDTLSGPTEETTYMLDNGGALFTFQKPFVITQADIDAQAEIKVDLVFNPENFGQAFESMGCAMNAEPSICDPLNNVIIDMPFVRMNPVPRKTGERTRKETYLMDYDADSKLRIELYYNDADDEAGIQGIDAAVVYEATAKQPYNNVIASNFVSQTGSVKSSDASVTLMDYKRTPNLEALLRRQDGTVKIHCLFPGALCPMQGSDVTRAYKYVGDSVVSTD